MGQLARMARAEAAVDETVDFASLVTEHQSMVFSIALHFLRDRQAAEEVAQDVFVQLHRNLKTFESREHITFWLRKVTSHRCIDFARRARRPIVSLEEVPELRSETNVGDPIVTRRLQRLVASLPDQARMVVILRFQEDLTPAEIGQALSMPVGTVKSHLHRSLALLREKYARVMGDAKT
jgi:RNA polymerase sigma-70 factor, ECF subfamily